MTAERPFADHFSERSDRYRRFRPAYPDTLFDRLAALAPDHETAWDCATGNGQAARGLAARFRRVFATDASRAQIAAAEAPGNVTFRVAPAERSGLPDGSVSLVTVAQALHWFDLEAFGNEVDRVLKPLGILAAWFYGLCRVSETVDPVLSRFYHDVVGPYWPHQRRHIDQAYRGIRLPFASIEISPMEMTTTWDLERFLGYLGTWSSVKRYRDALGDDAVERIRPEIEAAWGGPRTARAVRWPLRVLVSRKGY